MGKSKEIKRNDGRKYNRRLAPKPISTTDKLIPPAKTTKAKKERIASYAVSAMKEEFGSEKEFFKYLAKEARKSYNAMKLFLEYAYGKPSDRIDSDPKGTSKKAPQITFNLNQSPQQLDSNTIDITPDE